MIKKPSDTDDEGTYMLMNGVRVVPFNINIITQTAEIDENFREKNIMQNDKQSGAYIKFGEGVAKHWTKPQPPSAVPTPPEPILKPYPPMHRDVSQLRLDQFEGVYPYTAAYAVEPVEGLNLTVIVSGVHSAVDEHDLLNALTELLSYMHKQTYKGMLKL